MDMKKLLFSEKTWESDENCERMRGSGTDYVSPHSNQCIKSLKKHVK